MLRPSILPAAVARLARDLYCREAWHTRRSASPCRCRPGRAARPAQRSRCTGPWCAAHADRGRCREPARCSGAGRSGGGADRGGGSRRAPSDALVIPPIRLVRDSAQCGRRDRCTDGNLTVTTGSLAPVPSATSAAPSARASGCRPAGTRRSARRPARSSVTSSPRWAGRQCITRACGGPAPAAPR